MAKTASELRSNIYKLLDEVIETGKPLEIERKGKILRIMPPKGSSRLANLVPHREFILGDPEALIHMDWSDEWNP